MKLERRIALVIPLGPLVLRIGPRAFSIRFRYR